MTVLEPVSYEGKFLHYEDMKTYIADTKEELIKRKHFVNGYIETAHDIMSSLTSLFSYILYYHDNDNGICYVSKKLNDGFIMLKDNKTGNPIKNVENILYRTDDVIDGYILVVSKNKAYISNIYSISRMYDIPTDIEYYDYDYLRKLYEIYANN